MATAIMQKTCRGVSAVVIWAAALAAGCRTVGHSSSSRAHPVTPRQQQRLRALGAMPLSGRALTLTAVCCLLGLVGCGGTRTTAASERATTSPETTPGASSSSPPDNDTESTRRADAIKRARARERARAQAVADVVRDYYGNLDAKELTAAWARLSPSVRAQLGEYETWAAGQQGTVEVEVTSVHTERASKTSASVAVALRSTSVDVCSRTVHQRFAGTWTLSRSGGRWSADDLQIEKTGGGAERTDYAECDDNSGASPNSSAPAQPDYVPDDPGAAVPDPGDDPSFCDTHACIPNYDNGNGSTVQCADGTYSHSGGIQGACSHHGGEG